MSREPRRWGRDEKLPLVIYRPGGGSGFFSNVLFVLDWISYAHRHHLSPVVDMRDHPSLYRPRTPGYSGNDWELFFEQPAGVSLEQAEKQRHATNAGRRTGEFTDISSAAFNPTGRRQARGRMLVATYVRVLPSIKSQFAQMLPADKRSLGVHYRGTDMLGTRGHPQSGHLEHTLKVSLQCARRIRPDFVYLATDEERAVEAFHRQFGTDLVTQDAQRASAGGRVGLHVDPAESLDKYRLGIEVLLDVLALSRSHTLVAGLSNIPVAAVLFAEAPPALELTHQAEAMSLRELAWAIKHNTHTSPIGRRLRTLRRAVTHWI